MSSGPLAFIFRLIRDVPWVANLGVQRNIFFFLVERNKHIYHSKNKCLRNITWKYNKIISCKNNNFIHFHWTLQTIMLTSATLPKLFFEICVFYFGGWRFTPTFLLRGPYRSNTFKALHIFYCAAFTTNVFKEGSFNVLKRVCDICDLLYENKFN